MSGGSERDRSVVLDGLGDVLREAGDLAAAKARFEESLDIARKLAHDNPTSAEAQHDLMVSLTKFGIATGNRAALREAFDLALAITR